MNPDVSHQSFLGFDDHAHSVWPDGGGGGGGGTLLFELILDVRARVQVLEIRTLPGFRPSSWDIDEIYASRDIIHVSSNFTDAANLPDMSAECSMFIVSFSAPSCALTNCHRPLSFAIGLILDSFSSTIMRRRNMRRSEGNASQSRPNQSIVSNQLPNESKRFGALEELLGRAECNLQPTLRRVTL